MRSGLGLAVDDHFSIDGEVKIAFPPENLFHARTTAGHQRSPHWSAQSFFEQLLQFATHGGLFVPTALRVDLLVVLRDVGPVLIHGITTAGLGRGDDIAAGQSIEASVFG